MIIAGSVRHPVRFVMYYKVLNISILRFIFKTAKAIPIAGAREDKAMLESAYQEINSALSQGYLICVFPEGKITADGEMKSFKAGVHKMLEGNSMPVISVALSGLWGSLFSRKDKNLLSRCPRKLLAKKYIDVAAPLPAEIGLTDMKTAIDSMKRMN